MSERIDAAVVGDETPVAPPSGDAIAIDASSEQLAPSDHTMLRFGQGPQQVSGSVGVHAAP
jgi:hypothetical protein